MSAALPPMKHHHSHDGDSVGSDSDEGSSSTQEHNGGNKSSRPPPKKRNRAALSCTLCRERKVKCDRVIPCQQCIKRGDAEFCHLDPNKKGPEPKGRKSASSQQARNGSHRHSLDSNDTSSRHEHAQAGSMLAPSMQFSSSSYHDMYANPRTGMTPNEQYSSAISQMLPPFEPTQQPTLAALPRPVRHDSSTSSLLSNVTGSDDIDAIKTRLAQLEQALVQQQRGTPYSNASPSNYMSGAPSEGSIPASTFRPWNETSPYTGPFGPSPLPMSNSPASMSQHARGILASSPGKSGSSPYPANMFSPGQSFKVPSPVVRHAESKGDGVVRSALNAKEEGNNESDAACAARGDVDSDTEDAALVLEGLAMGSHCGVKKQADEKAALNIIEKAPEQSIQGFVDQDRAEDIMTEGKYRLDRGEKALKKRCDEVCKPDNESDDALYEYLKANPDADRGPDGKLMPPAKRICVLLARHESLFQLIWGPETMLGFGMGWAFTAAEAAGDMMKVSEIVGCKGALQREAVLRAVIRSLPQRGIAEHLVEVFNSRVKFMTGNVVHMPTFRKEMQAFYDLDTVEKRARVINFVDPGWLSLLLMIFVLALHFHPVERCENVLHLFDGRTIHMWRSAAQSVLLLARYQNSSSIAVLQTLILMNNIMLGLGKDTHHLVNVAITNALEMGLHRLGDKDKLPKTGENPATSTRREIAKRIWHQLKTLDWVLATYHAGAYRTHPNHFNTPLPGNYNDEDLSKSPLPSPRPDSEHTEMSYPLAVWGLAEVYRQNLDILNASESRKISCADMVYLDASYRGLLERAPSFYRIGSTEGEGQSIEVERWLFQQGVFSKLLRLHRPALSSRTSARTSCVLLARSILDMQRRIRSRCSIVDRLFINLTQSFSAASVLCLDLLQTRPTPAMRQIVRAEICEALEALRHVEQSHNSSACTPSQENSIRLIEALLAEEELRWNQPEGSSTEKRKRDATGPDGRSGRKSLLSLALRVARATKSDAVTETSETAPDAVPAPPELSQGANAEEQRNKDQHSRELFEQLMHGRPSFAEPSSFSQGPFSNMFGQQAPSVSAPGDFNFTSGIEGGPFDNTFDLSKFLAECESNSSPENGMSSTASDSGHSSLHGGGAGSSGSSEQHGSHFRDGNRQQQSNRSASDMSPANAFRSSSQTTPNGDVAMDGGQLAANVLDRPQTGLDGFWNWILEQGGANTQASPAPAGQDPGTASQAEQATGQGSNSSAPNRRPPLTATPSSFLYNVAGFNGNGARSTGVQQTLAGPTQLNNTSTGASSDASMAIFGSNNTPFGAPSSQSSAAAVRTPGQSNDLNALFSAGVGTPSAGVGAAWMSTPGLFDFAIEYGNDASSAPASSGAPASNGLLAGSN